MGLGAGAWTDGESDQDHQDLLLCAQRIYVVHHPKTRRTGQVPDA
jgi:hypothetical protein